MDIKDSYLHGTVGVVKSISVSADKLTYNLADIAGTVKEVTLPVATTSANGLMSSGDKTKLDNLSSTIGNYVTLNTDQEITGTKTFTKQLKFTVAKGTAPFLVTSDTKVTNLNADLLDGLDSTRYLHSVSYDSNLDFNVVKGINDRGSCVNNANYVLSGDGQLSNSPYSYGIMTTLNSGAAGMDFATNGPLGITIGLKFRKRWLNNLSEWKTIAFTDSNITGNAATADKLKTKRKLWGLDFDGTADVSGNMTGVGVINKVFKVTSTQDIAQLNVSEESSTVNYSHLYVSSNNTSNTNSRPLVLQYGYGNVGIGIIAPTQKLEVNGNVKATSFIGNLNGNADTATKLQTKRKLWGQEFDGSADVSGSLTGVTSINMNGDIVINDGVNHDRYIKWLYDNTDNFGWRIGYLGSKGGDDNDLTFDSHRKTEGWASALYFKHTTLNAHFAATVIAPTFQGNLDGTYVNKLTGYSKATSASNLAATDTLNSALGKLEYKADTAYSWYRTITDDDTDDIINKWDEVVDFVNGLDTDLTDEFVTRKTILDITGNKTFTKTVTITGYPSLILKAATKTTDSWIQFTDAETSDLHAIGIRRPTDSFGLSYRINDNYYKLLHAGNTYISNGVIVINGTSITPITSHQSLSNYVTLNTVQTITESKTFSKLVTFSATPGILITRSSGVPYLRFGKDSNNVYGAIGTDDAGDACVYNDVTGSGWSTLLHTRNYTNWVNTTNFPGLNKTGTVTSVTVTGVNGLSGTGTITTSGTITLSNAGVRSVTINEDYLRVNTNGTNTDLTIPYAIKAGKLKITAFVLNSDLNITTEGVYGTSASNIISSLSNKPSNMLGGECRLEVLHCNSSNYFLLLLYALGNNAYKVWHRFCRTGAWSEWIELLNSSNYNTFSPKLDGTGATGTWNISITGNAGSASTSSKLSSTTVISAKALSLSNASWTDTGYTFASLATGTYAVQVTSGTNLVASGIMSVYKNLSDTAGDEIPLHVYGTAGWRPYLRTYANKLLISSNDTSSTKRTVTIKIALIL